MRSYLDDVNFEDIMQRFEAFWNREPLDVPILHITAPKRERVKKNFPAPTAHRSIKEAWTNVDHVLKKAENYFESTMFLGDAVPWYLPNLGPNSFTAFLGADLKFISEETSWAEPFVENLSEYEPNLREDNKWWMMMNDILDAVCEVAEGNFLVGIPDMHYGGDSLAAAAGTQNLVKSLYKEPGEVKRLISKLTEICIRVFEIYYQKISRIQRGSITWIPTYSRGKYFALQDDFSGLVSPKMFEEFFLEEQITLANYLDNSIFHLDGPMAIGNLDHLLGIERLDGIQWVPGAGSKPMSAWIDLCLKILNADKCLVISCEPEEVELLLSKLKHGGLMLCISCRNEREARNILKIAEHYKGIIRE